MDKVWRVFYPNEEVGPLARRLLTLLVLVFLMFNWLFMASPIIPRPLEVTQAFGDMWMNDGLGQELITSFWTFAQAIFLASVISMAFAYSGRLPVVRPFVTFVTTLRYLGMVGLPFLFTMMFGGGHRLKLALLVFAVMVFLTTSINDIVNDVKDDRYDYARTLRMNEWQVTWEVVVLGTFDKVIDAIRQNAGIGWMMLPMVEGIVKSEGGIGTMIIAENKHFNIPQVIAIMISVMALGLTQDNVIVLIKRLVTPYAFLKKERS